ncbi:hypothetical protein [Anaerolentibacter hominis]|uniref:hypothetical protein n=1 Tax=Anaerolentibacter hominis TaxID=3079009 RepID=UPI0031B8AEDF
MEFREACDRIVFQERQKNGIGTLGEKTVHAVLKQYYEPDESRHEQKVDGFYADVVTGNGEILEIQTRSFDRLRKKLEVFLPSYPVTVIYPIPSRKWIYWIDDDGTMSKPRKSGKQGRPWDAFYELYKIKPFLTEENLTLKIVLLDMEEFRLLNGWSRDKKRGSSRYDRIPRELIQEIILKGPADYQRYMMPELGKEFTVKDYKAAAKTTDRIAGKALHLLNYVGAVEQIGMKGRAYVYARREVNR